MASWRRCKANKVLLRRTWRYISSVQSRNSSNSAPFFRQVTYTPPSWAAHLEPPVHGRVLLANLPTPVLPWPCGALQDLGVQWSIKRDDFTGLELSGNKVRKLEFLLSEALSAGHDSVVTVGNLQSNHCRATAAAARMLGLEPHLVLIVSNSQLGSDLGMDGNLLIDRMLGAKLHICAASDYYRYGGDLEAIDKLNLEVAEQLRRKGRRPYVVPVGGTAPLSAWAYIDAVRELKEQLGMHDASDACPFDHIVVPAGTGGTAAGLALGCRLGGVGARLHAVNVQHSPELFYKVIAQDAAALGVDLHSNGGIAEWISIHDGSGAGYARSAQEELEFVRDVSFNSGVLLDHVYTGKALYHFCRHARDSPADFQGKRILFWHTGGMYGLYSRSKELARLMPSEQIERVQPRE